jgi:uncharacterized protein (TIGR02996 family)
MDPDDDLGWFAVADWLEEHDDSRRAELVRLTRLLRYDLDHPDRPAREDRLVELLAAGVEPCVAALTNGIGMEFVYVPAGVLLMGSPPEKAGHQEHQGPVHEVEITRGFWLGKYPVTQAEYRAVTRKSPSWFSAKGGGKKEVKGLKTARFPVEAVSHADASKFCAKLSENEKQKERVYRLPSEAEWEYACRGGAGSNNPFHFGKTLSSHQANFDGNHPYGGGAKGPYLERTCEAGSYAPNAFGLHDLHGNVWEWCADWYGADYYADSPKADPPGPSKGSGRVIRGGGWNDAAEYCSAGARYSRVPASRSIGLGFRLLLSSAPGRQGDE